MINFYYRSVRDKACVQSEIYRKGAVEVIEQASQVDVAKMAEELELDVVDLVDVFDMQEIPRLEFDPNYMLLFVRSPLPLENRELMETQLYMLVYAKNRLCVVTHGDASLFLESLGQANTATTQTTKLIVQFLLKLSKRYSVYINEIAKKVEETRKLLDKVREKDIEQLLGYEAILNEYVAVLSPMQKISAAMTTKNHLKWFTEDKDLVEDLMNSLAQSVDVCLVNLKKILSLRNSFQIIFTNKLNKTVQLLTSVTIILTVPTMIASLFGMNVILPLSTHPQGFWVVVVMASIVSLVIGLVFKRNKWL